MGRAGEGGAQAGVVIVSHHRIGEEMLRVLHAIVPEAPRFLAVAVDPQQRGASGLRGSIAAALDEADAGGGVLVLTDMFGGTPANIGLSFLGERRVEVVTGFNLPMLVKLATLEEPLPLAELARFIRDYGQRNISVASELLPEEPG